MKIQALTVLNVLALATVSAVTSASASANNFAIVCYGKPFQKIVVVAGDELSSEPSLSGRATKTYAAQVTHSAARLSQTYDAVLKSHWITTRVQTGPEYTVDFGKDSHLIVTAGQLQAFGDQTSSYLIQGSKRTELECSIGSDPDQL